MALRTGRNTGAETSIFKSGHLPDGVAAMQPNGKKYDAFKDPALNRRPLTEQEIDIATDNLEWHMIADDYDESCGMASRQEFARELLLAVFDEYLQMDTHGYTREKRGELYTDPWAFLTVGFNTAAHIFLASLGVHRLQNNSRAIVPVTVLPQAMQDPNDALEAIALTKAPVQTDEITTLWNAIMAHLGKPTDQPIDLGNDYSLAVNKLTACLRHPGNKNSLVVGAALTDAEPMRPVFQREELRGFVEKVKRGQKPMKHGALASINVTPQVTVAAVTAPIASQKVTVTSGPLFCIRDYPDGWTRPEWCDLTNIGNEKTAIMVVGL